MKNKALHHSLPAYFSNIISCHSPFHSLHSTTMDLPSVCGTVYSSTSGVLHMLFLLPRKLFPLFPSHAQFLSHLSGLGSLVYSSVRPALTYTLALGETLCYLPWKDPPLLQWAYFSLLRFTNACDYLLNICHSTYLVKSEKAGDSLSFAYPGVLRT